MVVIKHWKIHNYIQGDRYKPTLYRKEKEKLITKDNKGYTLVESVDNSTMYPECIQNGYTGKVRLGKVSIGKDKESSVPKRFTPPSAEEVKAYCKERNNTIDAEHFIDYYEARGWMLNKGKMKDWKAAVRTWERNAISTTSKLKASNHTDDFSF